VAEKSSELLLLAFIRDAGARGSRTNKSRMPWSHMDFMLKTGRGRCPSRGQIRRNAVRNRPELG
jgi:hypothetical protein